MKYIKALAALLCILTLTGCSTQTDSTAPTEPVTETAAEAEALTEPETEVPTETAIPAPPPLSEKAAAWLYDTLVPQYGLSGLTSYDAAQPTLKSAQGVISALERDFTGDGTPDLLVVRQDEVGTYIELYIRTDEGYAMTDISPCFMAEDTAAAAVSVSVQDDLILVSTSSDPIHNSNKAAPYYRRYAVLSAADGTFTETAVLQFVSEKQQPGGFYINGALQSPASDDYNEQLLQYAQASLDALREGGVRIPDTEVMSGMTGDVWVIPVVSGMIQEQQYIMRHDHTTGSTVTAIDFTGLQRELTASTPEEVAYRFLRNELIPAYGLSESYIPYDLAQHQDKGIAPEFPRNVQGIVSAHVADLSGDGKPELLTVRAERTLLVIDWYRIGDDTCTWAASRELASFLPYLYLQEGKLLMQEITSTDDSYTAEYSALRLTDDGLEDALHIVQRYAPDKESITINGEETSAEPDALNADTAEQLVRDALDNAGIRYSYMNYVRRSDLPYDYPCNFLSIQIPDEAGAVLTPGGFGSHLDCTFWDHTRLHERLLGLSRLDTPLYDPSQISTSKPDTAS